MPSPSAQVAWQSATSSSFQAVASGATGVRGFSIREAAGATAVVRFRDGTSATAVPVLASVSLTANESDRDWFGEGGLQVTSGAVYVEIVSGTVEVTVWWA
jgi:hypothetical protein